MSMLMQDLTMIGETMPNKTKTTSSSSSEDLKKIEDAQKQMMKLFEGNDENTLALIEPLVQNACFMHYTLQQIQRDILSNGTTDSYQNGREQSGFKISASVQAYNAMVKNYNAVICKLAQYLIESGDKLDELDRWNLSYR